MHFQFQLDGRVAGPARREWAEAAQDAVAEGHAVWTSADTVQVDDQSKIARIPERDGFDV